MSALRLIYLGLAVLAAGLQIAMLLRQMPMMPMGAAYHDTYFVTAMWPTDLIAEIAFAVWAISETYVRKNWGALWSLPAMIFLGLGCGLPLFLFLRSRPIT